MSNTKRAIASNSPDHAQLTFTDDDYIWRFSPNQTDPELLEAIFVGREALLQNVIEKVAESAKTAAKHHVLLHGPRGIGKSHFVSLLKHRLSSDPKINPKIRIAWLTEDETTTSLVQLLVRVYRALTEEYPSDYSAEWLDQLLNQPPVEVEAIMIRRLVERFADQTLVILVENFNLLLDNLGPKGQQKLRAFLQEHPIACLIATTQQLTNDVTSRDAPFFGFFQNIRLKPLTLDEANQLLLNIARSKQQTDLAAFLESPDGRSRVRAVHHLAGGNHRVYIVLSGFITRESLDSLVVPFKKMADELTPYYQERLRWISAQQRQIVELLCRVRGTLTPKEIARRLLATENTISSQLRKLAVIGYLTSTRRGRESFYELSEPLMRLAYEVKQQSLLVMLIDFLRIWYRPEQMEKLRGSVMSASALEYIDAALERSHNEPDPRIAILDAEIEKANAEGRENELASIWEEKAAVTNLVEDWVDAGRLYSEMVSDHTTAIHCYDIAIEMAPSHPHVLNNKGNALGELGRYDDALECFRHALEIDPTLAYPWSNRSVVLNSLGRYQEAIECAEHALTIDPQFVNAWLNKGESLGHLGQHLEAIACYDNALEVDPKHANAWHSKGTALIGLGRVAESLECLETAELLDPYDVYVQFNKASILFACSRWCEGFGAIQHGFSLPSHKLVFLGNVEAYFTSIFQLSNDEELLGSRVSRLIDIYEGASKALPQEANGLSHDPIAYLGDGLVESLRGITAIRVSHEVLDSYVTAVENRVADIPQFEVPLRLFRYGIRYLKSKDTAEFAELIKPEREIVRQALNLEPEGDS